MEKNYQSKNIIKEISINYLRKYESIHGMPWRLLEKHKTTEKFKVLKVGIIEKKRRDKGRR